MNKTRQRALSVAAILVAVALAGCLGGTDPTPGSPAEEEQEGTGHRLAVTIDAVECPPGYDNGDESDLCLAYDGHIPGPTWVFQEGDRVEITLQHNISNTIGELDVVPGFAERYKEARFTMHRHGISQDACSDGVVQPLGTFVCDSSVGRDDAITYNFETPFPGYWHYHDHAHAFNTDSVQQPVLRHEGTQRGLWGSFLVLPEGETTDHVFDLHLLDSGINGGLGLDATIHAGERFDMIVTGLGHRQQLETVTLTHPDGETVQEVVIGPGVSRGFTVEHAEEGTYTWSTALRGEEHEGTITVEAATDTDPAQEEVVESRLNRQETGPALQGQTPRPSGENERTFVIPFEFWSTAGAGVARGVAGMQPMGLPLLEAYVGEDLQFHVLAYDALVPHTFHLHGHPWEDPETGQIIDTVPLGPDASHTHSFNVTAGLDEGYHGDWLYHCHIAHDAAMWGLMRVYPHSMSVTGTYDGLVVTVQDPDDEAIEGASITLRHNPHAPPDPTLQSASQGNPVPATITETRPGTYRVEARLPHGAMGELVIESHHDDGHTLARLTLLPDGPWVENRDVGMAHLRDHPLENADRPQAGILSPFLEEASR